MPAGVEGWNKAMGELEGKICVIHWRSPRQRGRGGELQEVACYRARDEIGVLADLEKR